MSIWRTSFERFNSGFNPPLYQKADVVFETDVPYEDDSLDEFIAAAWDAMWKQNPHWANPNPPLKGGAGWSSVLASDRYKKIK